MIRNYPDIRQTAGYDCGDAIADSVFKHFNVRTCSAVIGLATEDTGLHPSTLHAALRRAGLRVQSGSMLIADLKHHTRLGRPVLCPVAAYGGHWVAVLGVTPRRVAYHCPVRGLVRETHDSWTANWRDATNDGHAFDSWGIATW